MTELLASLGGVVLGGGLAGAIATLVKLKPERDRLVIENVMRSLEATERRATAAEQRVAELQEEVRALRARLRALEAITASGHRNGTTPK